MNDQPLSHANNGIGISLVDGEPSVRRARQIMLRSEQYDVRSYATCEAILADPQSREYPCIVADVHMIEGDGFGLLRQMRATGWRGRGILLDGSAPDSTLFAGAALHGDQVLARTIADSSLIAAIRAAVVAGLAGTSARSRSPADASSTPTP